MSSEADQAEVGSGDRDRDRDRDLVHVLARVSAALGSAAARGSAAPGAAARGRVAPIAPVVLIDGPSGAGKSTLALWLVENWPDASGPELVRMDDIYPGWQGLEAASLHIRDKLLSPHHRGRAARWQRHDWTTGLQAEWHAVQPNSTLIVEGCGTLSRANAELADVRIWLDADPGIRKSRALARDRGQFDEHWDAWQDSFDRFAAREHPAAHADIVLEATNWPPSLREDSPRPD